MLRTTLRSALLLCFVSSCGKGAVGEAVRPDERSGAEAMGEAPAKFDCTAVAPAAEPLVVDWADHERMDLGIKLREEGVAVVHYGCDGLRLLKHCKIDGGYNFAGSAASTVVIELKSADAVQASLPMQGIKFAAEVSGDSQIDVATAIIGRLGTMVTAPTKGDAKGECDGATHYVRSAYVGAFAMATGTKGKAAAAAEVFKFSASGSSESSRHALTTDGELGVCEAYDPDANPDAPPGKCRAAIRLELAPLAEGAAAKPPPNPEKEGLANSCPAGFVSANGACERPAAAPAYRCDRANFEDCKTQCEKGNADSCYNAGLGPLSEKPVAPNDPNYAKTKQAKAPFMEKACAGGVGLACNSLAIDHDSKNSGMLNPPKAVEYFKRACYDLFLGASCMFLSSKHLEGKGVPKDPRKAVALLERACNIGYASGCNRLGEWYLQGSSVAKVAKNPKKGIEVMKSACEQGKVGYSCLALAKYFTTKKDPAAAQYKAKGCALEPKSFDCK
jgi:hypothetical protein